VEPPERRSAHYTWRCRSASIARPSNVALTPPATASIGADDEILAALRASTLADRRNLLDAVPQRFSRALDEASRLLEPKAQRVVLPKATIHDTGELERWLAGVHTHVEAKLRDGPVIL
jgi:hypothetical protein